MAILLFVALIFSLQLKSVQTYVAKRAAKYLSNELHTVVDVKSLYIKPFKSVVLEGLYVQDLDRDTLLYSPNFAVDLNAFSIKERRIGITSLQLDSGKFYLKSYKKGGTNLKFIIDYFKPKPKPGSKSRPFNLTIDKVVLNEIAFKYRNYSKDNALKRINFNDLDLKHLHTAVLHIDTKNHLFDAQINNLAFVEKSGFKLNNLTTRATIDTNKMEFKKLYLETPESKVGNYLLMRYNKFADFKKFVDKVYVKANLAPSTLHSKDISFFADATKKMNLQVKLKGSLSGYVKSIRAKNFFLSAGQATYLKGNFNIKGLPSIKSTYLDLTFNQLHTNQKDVLYLVKAIGAKMKPLPAAANKLGNVSFNGLFKGLVNDFAVIGSIKTNLGLLNTNLHMELKGTPSYSGVVKASNFNLGALLSRTDIGRTSLTANIKGAGFKVKDLTENIHATAQYFDYKGYRYTNINIDGTYNKHFFLGKALINDRNVKLSFNGGINFDVKVPEFQFTAVLRNTNFHKLGFTKDTIQVDANIRTNFSGTNINDIQGSFEIRKIRITRPSSSIIVDSLDVVAGGTGVSRSLTVRSDILDAGLNGQYALKELPLYFNTVIKKYVPSLKLKTATTSAQIFNINLKIKYFEPLAAFLIPTLKIPEGATFNGSFNSTNNTATVNGFASTIEYKGITLSNLILDESTSNEALNIFATADKIDFNKRFYIQNINVANILKNDSLALNVKLSDKDAINQLDLNGLIEFSADTAARLSILPSDLIINKEGWRIQEKVKLKFDQNKVYIEGFELFRQDQLLTVDGVLSADPKDVLNVSFNKFKLSTFNSLTEKSKVTLGGQMNGKLVINTPLKKPKIESDIKIDSLTMNNILIGEATVTASLDNETRLVDLEMNILKEGKETLFASGTYNANSENNKLDLDLIMNSAEVVLFQPFIKNLVSDLTGTLSAQLKVAGNPLNPHINGHAKLNEVGLTVNYLKTPYRINDEVGIENSIIHLNNLTLRDIYGNSANVNGTVDMHTPKIPDIDVTIVAQNKILALNTTAKDNPVYYGKAFGSGTFKFRGPTNNMRIDIDAKTEKGTEFFIPLNGSERVGTGTFITFVPKDTTIAAPKISPFNNLYMKFNLSIDENSEVNIITDVGRLKARGKAENLELTITSSGTFEMRNIYQVSSGKFNFSAKDFIQRQFDLIQGGTIRWNGDPTAATINLTAKYTTTANVRDLYLAANVSESSQGYQKVPSEAIIYLQGPLTQPGIAFDINFPSDPTIKERLSTYLSNEDNKRFQAASLIARGAFTNNSNLSNVATETLASAGTELGASIFNSILSQWLKTSAIDINVRSLGDVGVSGRLFGGRLRVTTGFTATGNGTSNDFGSNFNVLNGSSSIARDVDLQYAIKKDESLIARASQRLTNRGFLTTTSLTNQDYVNGLGLVYRKDFDTLGEFLRAIIGRKREEERQQTDPAPAPINPGTPSNPTVPAPTPPGSASSGRKPAEP